MRSRSAGPAAVPVAVLLLVGLPAVTLAVLRPVPVEQSTEAELLEADRAFARAAAESGIEGWMSFMAADAARMARPGASFIVGEEAIRAADRPLLDSAELQLTWEPTAAHLYDDGIHGATTGDYRVLRRDDGSVTGCGSYVSLWRESDDGWKVIFDTGVATPPRDC